MPNDDELHLNQSNSHTEEASPITMVDASALSHDMERLFESESFCDVSFLVGPQEKQIMAHRGILTSRSDYFHNMFTVGLRESQENIVKKPNIRPDVFYEVLRFIYSGKVNICNNNVIEVLKAAAEMDLCKLKKLCLSFIENHSKNCFENQNFLSQLSESTLIEILQSDYLNLSESYIFERVMDWGIFQSSNDLVNTLKNVIQFVRFPLMRPDYLSQRVEPLQVVPHLLIFEAYRYYSTNDASHVRNRRSVLRGDEGHINPNKKGVYMVQMLKEGSHAHFRWRIVEFSKLNKKYVGSPVFNFGEQEWKLILYPKGDTFDSHLSLFLNMVTDGNKQCRTVHCDFTLRVVNQIDMQHKSVDHEVFSEQFTKYQSTLGRQQFMPLNKLDAGFLIDDVLYIDLIIKFL
ncbi:actin-binding protein IPP [Acrasis kona]|uniref:Actin-binding protein IPP n=1 Tax=Acrasis kona TaxID=1008807 RepID=A0AAW2ZDJ0_9EUKA